MTDNSIRNLSRKALWSWALLLTCFGLVLMLMLEDVGVSAPTMDFNDTGVAWIDVQAPYLPLLGPTDVLFLAQVGSLRRKMINIVIFSIVLTILVPALYYSGLFLAMGVLSIGCFLTGDCL